MTNFNFKFLGAWLVIVASITGLQAQNDSTLKGKDEMVPAGVWNDVNGEYINAHGGGILLFDSKYYWFGEHRPAKGFSTEVGVTCYSSTDLCNWRYEGVALSVSEEAGNEIEKGCIMERPKVIYNKRTKKFVMWFHLELKGKGYEAARAGVAVSDSPTGPYCFVSSSRVCPGIFPLNMTEEERDMQWNMEQFEEWWTPEWREAVNKGLFVKRDLVQCGGIYIWEFKDEEFFFEYPVGDQSSRIELEEMWRLIHPDDLTAFKLLWQSLWKADKEVFQCRARFAGSDYEWWEFRFSAMPAVDNAEGGKDVSGILININDMKKREKELILMRGV
mgnify:CR=1 FL=1